MPFVTLKAALSADGYLAPAQQTRTPNQPHWLTGSESREEVQRLRHASDAVLTGIGTVLADDPALTDRSGILGPGGQTRRRPLLRVILDTHLRIPLSSQLVRTANSADGDNSDLLILTAASASPEKIEALHKAGAEVRTIPEQDGHLILVAALKILGERSILSILLESGTQLNGAFLRQNLVDKAILFYSGTELGPQSLPFAEGITSPYLFQQSLHRTSTASFGSDDCITGYLHDPWSFP